MSGPNGDAFQLAEAMHGRFRYSEILPRGGKLQMNFFLKRFLQYGHQVPFPKTEEFPIFIIELQKSTSDDQTKVAK